MHHSGAKVVCVEVCCPSKEGGYAKKMWSTRIKLVWFIIFGTLLARNIRRGLNGIIPI